MIGRILGNLANRGRGPRELVADVKDNLAAVHNPAKAEKAKKDLTPLFNEMRIMLYGDSENEPRHEDIVALTSEIMKSELIEVMINNLHELEFEARKHACSVFNSIIRREIQGAFPVVVHLSKKKSLMCDLIHGYSNYDIALSCGSMLRECIRFETLAKTILYDNMFYELFKYVDQNNFEIASDAFLTFRELLTTHKTAVAEFLESNYTPFFKAYKSLLRSENYVTRRQSVRLLGELLLDRSNFSTMSEYISKQENLKTMMRLLRDKRNIQYEAFHVFKVFVANPHKPQAIKDILLDNKKQLITFLTNFQKDREVEDEQFKEEKTLLIKTIQALKRDGEEVNEGANAESESNETNDQA